MFVRMVIPKSFPNPANTGFGNDLGMCVLKNVTTPTEDRYGTDYCSAAKSSNATAFKEKCDTDSGFRFYFCGVTCDGLYSTAETLQASKASALAYACDDMFTSYFCNNMKNTSKCAGNTTFTAFRLCTKTCGYC